MLTRRQLFRRTLQGSSLIAFGGAVPEFLVNTAAATEAGGDTILVVLELDGGNDGLNTVIPYADDEYIKARPTLHYTEDDVIRLNDTLGLNRNLWRLGRLWEAGQVGIVQGVGYPNPQRSHLQSAAIWHTADPGRNAKSGWLARGAAALASSDETMPAMHVGLGELPEAMRGTAFGVKVHFSQPFELLLDGTELIPAELRPEESADAAATRLSAKRQLLAELTRETPAEDHHLLQFARRCSLQAQATVDQLHSIAAGYLQEYQGRTHTVAELVEKRSLEAELLFVSRLIAADLGTRIFYVKEEGFDTHVRQKTEHEKLLWNVGHAIARFFSALQEQGDAERVVLVTVSEFGRRLRENSNRGTDHGAGSCLFVVGPRVNGGILGEHPRLDQLVSGDLAFHTDFRQVYASLLDQWLGCNSAQVLGSHFDGLPLIRQHG